MPYEKGNKHGKGQQPYAHKRPTAEYADEPDAPPLLRDMRWVAGNTNKKGNITPIQKGLQTLLEVDAPRFIATLERLEAEWALEKRKREEEANRNSLPPPGESDGEPQSVTLDEVSARVVGQIDRWLAAHKARAEALHPL